MDQREQAVIMSNLPDLIVPLRSGEDEGIQYMCEAWTSSIVGHSGRVSLSM